jgi:hypothetical protein
LNVGPASDLQTIQLIPDLISVKSFALMYGHNVVHVFMLLSSVHKALVGIKQYPNTRQWHH